MTDGSAPTVIDSFGTFKSSIVVVDPSDRIFTVVTDGTVKLYDSSGALVDDMFATGSVTALAYADSSSLFDEGLYGLIDGDLVRFDGGGVQTDLGTIFSDASQQTGSRFAFGPDGALYVSYPLGDQVLRITPANQPVPEPSSFLTFAGLGLCIGLIGRRRRHPCDPI